MPFRINNSATFLWVFSWILTVTSAGYLENWFPCAQREIQMPECQRPFKSKFDQKCKTQKCNSLFSFCSHCASLWKFTPIFKLLLLLFCTCLKTCKTASRKKPLLHAHLITSNTHAFIWPLPIQYIQYIALPAASSLLSLESLSLARSLSCGCKGKKRTSGDCRTSTTHTSSVRVVAEQTATHWTSSGQTPCTNLGQCLPQGEWSGLVKDGHWFKSPWGKTES